MKKIYSILIGLMMCFTLSSCAFETYATTQDDIYVQTEVDVVRSTVDYQIVIKYGTPYYYNGSILYYIYDNLYYYPYYYDNYWYFRCYRRPFPYTNYRPYFRPHRYDYRFYEGYRHPRGWYRYEPSTRPHNYRPNNRDYHRPGGSNIDRPARPNIGDRPSRGSFQPRVNPGNSNRSGNFGRPSTPSRGGSVSRPSGGSRGSFGGRR